MVHRRRCVLVLAAVAVLATALFTTAPLAAQETAVAALSSLNQVPALIEGSRGGFSAEIVDLGTINYTLTYDRTDTPVMQAHIHIAQEGVNGAVAVFLCTNLGNGPPGTPGCPASGAVSGTLTDLSVVTAAQGVSSLASVVRAMRQGAAYVNVHTEEFPPGEIRGQIGVGGPR